MLNITNQTIYDLSETLQFHFKVDCATVHIAGCLSNNVRNKHFFAVCRVVEHTEVALALLLHALLFSMIVNQRKIRSTKSCKLFLNLQLVHVLLLLSKSVEFVNNGYDEFHVYVSNGLLIQFFISMTLATIDRLIAIKYPYIYGRICQNQVIKTILLSWLPGLVFTIVAVIVLPSQESMSLLSACLIGVSMSILFTSNVCIYVIAQRHWTAIQVRCCTRTGVRGFEENKRLKSLYVSLSIVVSFFVFWMPYLVHSAVVLTSEQFYVVDEKFTASVEVVAFANSLADPLLFVIFRKDAKKELMRVIRKQLSRIYK